MERLISGFWWAVILGIGAFAGIMLFSQNLDHAVRTTIDTFICGFFLGLFLEVPGVKRGKDSAKRVIDWNFVAKWSVGFSIFLFGFMCMTARDTGIRAYNLGAINNQQISWTAVEQKIIPQIFIGGIVSFVLLILTFAILTLWAYFVRKNKTQSVDQVQKEVKLGLDILFGFSAIVGLMLLYYSLVENRGHALAVEGIVIVALAYFTRSKAMLIACYVLLAAFLYLLVKYSIAIEGNRLLVLSLNSAAICTWIISCSLWKAKPLFNFQRNINKSRSDDVATDSIRDKFYKVAYDEITINRADPVLWAKAFAHAEGNQDKAKALYIKYRVEQLSALPVQQPQTVSPADSTELPDQHEVFRDQLRNGSAGPAMIVIPAGEFWMGSPENEAGRGRDECRHQVRIAQPFAIGQYAVTFSEYDRFCDAQRKTRPKDQGWRWGRSNRPVINISWLEAFDYAEWLSAQTGQTYRLPTEAEWEYTARAGTETAFWWGNEIKPDRANYSGFYGKTVPVDQFQPNPWGLYQVHGNIWEWTGSRYDPNYAGAETLRVKYTGGSLAVRGGGWGLPPARVRSAYRDGFDPADRSFNLGFRLARSL